jgi:hypothetical protein
MAAHRKSQQKTHRYDTKTREDLKGLDEDLMARADAKIEEGCGHIIMPITIAFRGKKPHQIASRKEKVQKILQGAKPGPPPKTIHRKLTETQTETAPDGTVRVVTRVIEEDIPAGVWQNQEKRRKTNTDGHP